MINQEKRDDDILQILLLPVVVYCDLCDRPLFRTSVRRPVEGGHLEGVYECRDCKRLNYVDPPGID